jgi:hypothetical protein
VNETDGWLVRYEESHRELSNPLIYWAAVPLVVFGTVGLLWAIPVPDAFYEISPLLNWGSAFLMAAAVYYFIISISLAIGMLPFMLGVAAFQMWLMQSNYSLVLVASEVLIAGVIGLWLGQRNNGGIRPVVQDLQLMMIGPAWLLSVLYRRAGIPY